MKWQAPEPRRARTLAGAAVGEQAKPTERPEVAAQLCEACGTQMYGLHCKLVCPNCGYKRDCSDP